MAGDDGRAAGEAEPGRGLPRVARASHEDEVDAVVERRRVAPAPLHVAVEEPEDARGCRRRVARLAEREQAGVLGMNRLDVLQRVELLVEMLLRDLRRQ